MKAIVLEKSYSKSKDYLPEFLKYVEDYPIPDISDHADTIIKVHATGLNPVDFKVGAFGVPTPTIIGFDIAGVVHKVGPHNIKFKVGDRIYGMSSLRKQYGGYAEYAAVQSRGFAHIPEGVSFVEAASLPIAGWTAYKALLDKARFRAGETVLVTAGAGGVGGYAIQLAKLGGAHVITTSSSKNFAYVKELGADYVIDYNTEDIHKRVQEITNGRGVDIWVDLIGSESADIGLKSISFGGQLVIITGNPTTTLGDLFTKQVSVHEVFLAGAWEADLKAQENLGQMAHDFIQLIHDKKLRLLPIETITLKEVPQAIARIKDGHVKGKLVAKIHD